VAREEVNDRPGGGRRQVEGNTASMQLGTPPSEGEVVGTTAYCGSELALHEPVCHTRQQATVPFVVRVNTSECTEFGDIIKS
jgi:hypothetical protein